MTVHSCMACMLMLVSMGLTLMQGHSGSATAKHQRCIISTTKQAISIKLTTTVGHFSSDFDFENVYMVDHRVLLLSSSPSCQREAGHFRCLPPVWNFRAIISFHFSVCSLVILPGPVAPSVLFLFVFLTYSPDPAYFPEILQTLFFIKIGSFSNGRCLYFFL